MTRREARMQTRMRTRTKTSQIGVTELTEVLESGMRDARDVGRGVTTREVSILEMAHVVGIGES